MKKKLVGEKSIWFLLAVCIVFFFLRLPSFFEPNWYGDEGIYQTVGRGLRQGWLLYRDIWDNKPPLLYVLYAMANSDQMTMRILSFCFGVGSVLTFFFLSKKVLGNNLPVKIATLFFTVFFGLPSIEGNIANAENFVIFPVLLAGYLLYDIRRVLSYAQKKRLFFAGLLLGFAFLIKSVALFDATAFFAFLFFSNGFQNNKKFLCFISPYILGFLLPFFTSLLFFFFQGSGKEYINAVFFENIGYVDYDNFFVIPKGLLYVKIAILSSFLFLSHQVLKKKDKTLMFIVVWIAFSLFSVLFSGRPYTHYLLVLLPVFSLFIGLLFHTRFIKAKISIAVFLCIILQGIQFLKFPYRDAGETIAYYQNFLFFFQGKKDFSTYASFFDTITPRDYTIAAFIKNNTRINQRIFLWGNSAQIYTLSNTLPIGKYTVAYHINSIKDAKKDTQKAFAKIKPKYIIIMPEQDRLPVVAQGYTYRLTIDDTHIYEKTF